MWRFHSEAFFVFHVLFIHMVLNVFLRFCEPQQTAVSSCHTTVILITGLVCRINIPYSDPECCLKMWHEIHYHQKYYIRLHFCSYQVIKVKQHVLDTMLLLFTCGLILNWSTSLSLTTNDLLMVLGVIIHYLHMILSKL